MKDYIYIVLGLLVFFSIIVYETYKCHKRGLDYSFGDGKCVMKRIYIPY